MNRISIRNIRKAFPYVRQSRRISSDLKKIKDEKLGSVKLSCFSNELRWRRPYHERSDEWYSKFTLFASNEKTHSDMIRLLQTDIDVRPSAIAKWWREQKKLKVIDDQRFIEERHVILGNELAAAHFVVHRGGCVKFYNEDMWLKRDQDGEYDLPNKYDPSFVVEAVDCSEMTGLHYEGLENLRGLKGIRKLCLKGCKDIDDWCLDRISGQFGHTLVELDLRQCPRITERGLVALYRLRRLGKLYLTGPEEASKHFEMTCLLLEDVLPNLEIVISKLTKLDS